MDVRAPTHELTRAHAVLRARRRIAEAKPEWALSAPGLSSLRGRGEREQERSNRKEGEGGFEINEASGREEVGLELPLGVLEADPHLAAAFDAVDAANARAERRLADETRIRPERDSLIYDPDWDEEERLDHWRDVVDQTRGLPPTLG